MMFGEQLADGAKAEYGLGQFEGFAGNMFVAEQVETEFFAETLAGPQQRSRNRCGYRLILVLLPQLAIQGLLDRAERRSNRFTVEA